MFTVRVGKSKMVRRQKIRGKVLQCLTVLLLAAVLIILIRQNSKPLTAVMDFSMSEGFVRSGQTLQTSSKQQRLCNVKKDCPEDHFSFFLHSGAANVLAPKFCFQNNLVLGTILNNAGNGINIVIINGRTGEVTKTGHFDMYAGDVKPLIDFLKSIEMGSVVLMASYDDPATKLNDEARKLIAQLGSSDILSLGFRDNWVFAGGKGAAVKSSFEKYLKNDNTKNKYENWPELIELEGCIPKFPE